MKTYLFAAGLLAGVALSGLESLRAAPNQKTQKPNLVFILADDLGYMDVAALRREGAGRGALGLLLRNTQP